jgi:hypothetical protein
MEQEHLCTSSGKQDKAEHHHGVCKFPVKHRILQLYPESVPIHSYLLVQQILISGSIVTTVGYANKGRQPPDTKGNCKYAELAVL